jgi:rhodanese-related sulfurtransferase
MKFRHLILAFAASVGLFSAQAQAVDNPDKLAGATIVSADKAKELLAKGATVIDVRSANEYAEGHIKGAKLVAYKEKSAKAVDFDATKDEFDLSKLPADKNADLVLYCNGLECWKSYKAGTAAVKAGYKKVSWLRGGLPEWKAKGGAVE